MNMTLKKQLGIMAAIAVIAVLLLSLIGFLTTSNSSVGSEQYRKIIHANELTADILPPPLYMVEMMMKVEMLGQSDADNERLIDEIKGHIADFNAREKYWMSNQVLSANLNSYIQKDLSAATNNLIKVVEGEVIPVTRQGNPAALQAYKVKARGYFEEHKSAVENLVSQAEAYAKAQAEHGERSVDAYQFWFYLLVGLSIVGVLVSSWVFSKDILNRLGADPAVLQGIATKIASGDSDVQVPHTDNQSSVLWAFDRMVDYIKSSVSQNIEATRILASLDATSTNVMIADEDRNIIYMNQSVEAMLREAEPELKRVLPNFAVDKILSSNMDIFHKNPSHQADLLRNLTGKYESHIQVGNLQFRLIANPIFSDDGQRLGTVVEWLDVTKAKELEHRTARMMAALEGTSTNIMIADADRNIIYMNASVEKMLRGNEADIKKVLPNFAVDKILSSNMDIFHKDPAHQAALLERLDSPFQSKIQVGNLHFRLIASPVLSEDGERLGSVVEWLDITESLAEERRNTRIMEALNGTSTCVMIADDKRNIIYMNKAVEKMLRNVESDLRKELPKFAVDEVIGSNIDIFHKNPAHQISLLERLTTPYETQIKVGGLYFQLIASPINGKGGERLGTVVEWQDRTSEVEAEDEVSRIVDAATKGDFSERARTEGKEGFMLNIAQGLNSLIEITDQGLQDIAKVLMAIADGNLTERIDGDYQGTFADLANYCNTTSQNLTTMIGEIRGAADVINGASAEIAQGNADLSNRTEQQASSLEETASSMEELTGTVRLNAENANQANGLASEASTVAIDGGALIQQVVETMTSINESAQKISDIIGVIDGIAFQTNILALNAAVEAARAGEQGRGFAVVASEVRTLAQRSANAAKDIKELISDSVAKIENGNNLVNRSGETMQNVVTSIKRVNDIMSEIAAASAEQASGIDEIGKAVTQMDEVTQQNAALVEEAAAAAESLQSQAQQLANRVSTFVLDESEGDSAPPALAAPAKLLNKPTENEPESTPAKAKPAPSVKAKPSDPEEDEWESF